MSQEKQIRLQPETITVQVTPAQQRLLNELSDLDAREAGDTLLRIIQNYTGDLDESAAIDVQEANDISVAIRIARIFFDINADFNKFAIA